MSILEQFADFMKKEFDVELEKHQTRTIHSHKRRRGEPRNPAWQRDRRSAAKKWPFSTRPVYEQVERIQDERAQRQKKKV